MENVAELTAGGLGGFACVITGQPFDTIKVKLQTYPSQFKTPMQAFRKTLMQVGFSGMYAGCSPAIVSNIAENAVLFLCYGSCQRAVKWLTGARSTDDLTVFQQACSGSLASVLSSIAITPPERVKCILQADSQHNEGQSTRRYRLQTIILLRPTKFMHINVQCHVTLASSRSQGPFNVARKWKCVARPCLVLL